MIDVNKIQSVIRNKLCLGCGFCTIAATTGKRLPDMSIEYSDKFDHFIPVNCQAEAASGQKVVCPGSEIDMVELSRQVYGKLPENYLLGVYEKIRTAYASDQDVRQKAASGGIIPAVLKYLFRSKQIDRAYVLDPGASPYSAHGVVIESEEGIDRIHGSVYHPTNFGINLSNLFSEPGKFAFVGLPCQVEGLEMLKRCNPHIADNHYISLGLFCGGVNTFKGIAYYIRAFGVSWDNVKNIAYRHGYWPGKICVETRNPDSAVIMIPRIRGNSRWKILRYVIAFQGYWMLRRCRLCPDQINDFADIAVGDPHLPRYRRSESWGFSLVITRTGKGEEIISRLEKRGLIATEYEDESAVVDSQGYALDNRRHVKAYCAINHLLGNKNPHIRTYPAADRNTAVRHYVYALVDLIKIKLPQNRLLSFFYIPWQIFEYLFITFTPSIIFLRIRKLIKNV